MPAGKIKKIKRVTNALLGPGIKAIKATKKGLKRSGKSPEHAANLMAIKTALDATGIKNPATRKKIRKILQNHLSQLDLMRVHEKRGVNAFLRLKVRVSNQLIEELGKDQANKIILLLHLADVKRIRLKRKLNSE